MKKSISRVIIMVAIISILKFINIHAPELFYDILTIVVGVLIVAWAVLNLFDD